MNHKFIKSKEEYYLCVKNIKRFYKEIGMSYGDETLSFFVTANFISKKQIKDLQLKTEQLTKIIDKVVNLHLEQNKFSEQFNLPKKELEIINIDRGFKKINVFNRYDLFVYKDRFKVIEINPESPSGMGRTHFIDQIFLKQKPFQKEKIVSLPDTREFLLNGFLSVYKEWGGKKNKPVIAIVDLKGVKTISDQIYIQEYFETKGHKTIICDPRELKFNKGLFYNKTKINIVYKRFITTDYLDKPSYFKGLIQALEEKKVCMINPFASRIIDDKSLLTKLQAGVFDEILTLKEKKLVKEIIPWSMEINNNSIKSYKGGEKAILEYILKNKNNLVLKPSIAYGGVGVFIGENTAEKEWEKAARRSLREKKWIIQEYLEIPTIEVPIIKKGKIIYEEKYINLCPFVINKKVAGFVTRISSSKIINTTQGGGMIPTFIE
ncbi:glutathionylspermidine synthase family protein [Candidatus Woesearchaeota archaeon]|nr:glutathionylspermidine synthase family protein [Candidatus Woesearchaeota archaeon]